MVGIAHTPPETDYCIVGIAHTVPESLDYCIVGIAHTVHTLTQRLVP